MSAEYYHVHLRQGYVASDVFTNLSLNDLLLEWVCPYIMRDAVCVGSTIDSYSIYDRMTIYSTSKPIDSDFPINRAECTKDKKDEFSKYYTYRSALIIWLDENGANVTAEIYAYGLKYIEDRTYERYKKRFSLQKKISFMIMPLDNPEVRHNFDYVIKPSVEKYGYQIDPIDKIDFTGQITNEILNQIVRSTFVVADLSDERPNCYYEVGYAQALGKPVIIIAKEGTKRHFDISIENWLHWKDYKDLKEKFDLRLKKLIDELQEPVTEQRFIENPKDAQHTEKTSNIREMF